MKKPSKHDIINGAQFLLMMYMIFNGFCLTYSWMWYVTGLPFDWWTLTIAMALAILSTFGLVQWIANS